MNDTLNTFVDKLLEEKGLSDMEPAVLAQMKTDLADRVEDKINAVMLEKMPPEKLAGFEKLLDSNTSEQEIQKFCQENIPDLESVLATTLLEFRSTYLNL